MALARAIVSPRGYAMGRPWKLAVWARFQVEVKDRTLAFTGPHSGRDPGSRRRQFQPRICESICLGRLGGYGTLKGAVLLKSSRGGFCHV
ncbi:hypothetical protein EFS30_09665 [Levilactobacillus parabrevis]|nr:hypothetical protein [Levilactobacillus parabrevis]